MSATASRDVPLPLYLAHPYVYNFLCRLFSTLNIFSSEQGGAEKPSRKWPFTRKEAVSAFSVPWPLFGLRRLCAGIALAFAFSGAGSLVDELEGRRRH
jgi:hypothetical protein